MRVSDRAAVQGKELQTELQRVELLIATMHQKDDSILDRMHVQSDAIVINQCQSFAWREFQRGFYHVRFLSCKEYGVGLSRNTALMRAEGDICLFADDDLIYCDGYDEKIVKAFLDFPDADVLVFNIQSTDGRKSRYHIQKPMRIRWFNFARYGAARIAIRRASILRKHISFSLLFGGGTQYSCGEDTLFLHDCLKAGLKIYAVPITLADVDDSTSSWFHGYDEKYLMDRGALYRAMYPRTAFVQSVIYLLRHKKVWKETSSFIGALRMMKKGIQDYNIRGGNLEKKEEACCGSVP